MSSLHVATWASLLLGTLTLAGGVIDNERLSKPSSLTIVDTCFQLLYLKRSKRKRETEVLSLNFDQFTTGCYSQFMLMYALFHVLFMLRQTCSFCLFTQWFGLFFFKSAKSCLIHWLRILSRKVQLKQSCWHVMWELLATNRWSHLEKSLVRSILLRSRD